MATPWLHLGNQRGPSGTPEGPFHAQGVGWRGRIRTFNPLIQSQVPYRLATRQRPGQDSRGRAAGPRATPSAGTPFGSVAERPSGAPASPAREAQESSCPRSSTASTAGRWRPASRSSTTPTRSPSPCPQSCGRIGPLPGVRRRGPAGRRGAVAAHRARRRTCPRASGWPARRASWTPTSDIEFAIIRRRMRILGPPARRPREIDPVVTVGRATRSSTTACPIDHASRHACWAWPSTWAPRPSSSASSTW